MDEFHRLRNILINWELTTADFTTSIHLFQTTEDTDIVFIQNFKSQSCWTWEWPWMFQYVGNQHHIRATKSHSGYTICSYVQYALCVHLYPICLEYCVFVCNVDMWNVSLLKKTSWNFYFSILFCQFWCKKGFLWKIVTDW